MYYSKDFSLFFLDTFGGLRQDICESLRDLLQDKRVYVKRRRGMLTHDALYTAAQDDISSYADELSANCSKRTLEEKAVQPAAHQSESSATAMVLSNPKGKFKLSPSKDSQR